MVGMTVLLLQQHHELLLYLRRLPELLSWFTYVYALEPNEDADVCVG